MFNNSKNSSINLWSFCLGGVLLGTVLSQTLLDFFSVVLTLGLIRDFIKDPKATRENFKMFGNEWAIFGYFIAIILGYVINSSPDAPIAKGLFKFMWVPTVYVYYYAFIKTKFKFDAEKTVKYFTYAYLVTNIYAIATYAVGYDYLSFKEISRAVGVVNSATYHAHGNAFILVLFCMVLYFKWGELQKSTKIKATVAASLFLLSVMVTLTRGAWLVIFLSLPFFFFIEKRKYFIWFCASGLVIFICMFTFWSGFRERIDMSREANQTSERENLLIVNYQMWREYPLLGIGYGENQRRNREYWDREEWQMPEDYNVSHAHNQAINVLTTTGVVGVFFFLLFYVNYVAVNVRELLKAQKGTERYKFLLLAMVMQFGFIVSCLTDVTFEYAKLRTFILITWALLLAVKNAPYLKNSELKDIV